MDEILTLTHAAERDIDLLLVEEFKSSPDFVRWFSGQVVAAIGGSIPVGLSQVMHSRRRTAPDEVDLKGLSAKYARATGAIILSD